MAGRRRNAFFSLSRSLQFWIESNISSSSNLLRSTSETRSLSRQRGVASIARSGQDTTSSCLRTCGRTLCTDPTCYHAKVDAHVAKTVAAKPKLVQISTAYGQQQEGSPTLPRNKYTEIRPQKPTTKKRRPDRSSRRVSTPPKPSCRTASTRANCGRFAPSQPAPVHHPKKQSERGRCEVEAEQEKQRKEAAIANTTGIRILAAITAAVPVRLVKRDLLFVVERLASLLDEKPSGRSSPVNTASRRRRTATPSGSCLPPTFAVLRKAHSAAYW